MKRFAALALPLVFAACSSSNNIVSQVQPGDAEAAIKRQNHDFMVATIGGSSSFVDSFYAPDAVVLASNMPALHGRDAIRQMWSSMLGGAVFDVKLTTDNVMQSCDMATEVGRYDLTLTPKAAGGGPLHDVGKYVVTWKKNDGKWQAVTDMFSSDLPLPGQPAH